MLLIVNPLGTHQREVLNIPSLVTQEMGKEGASNWAGSSEVMGHGQINIQLKKKVKITRTAPEFSSFWDSVSVLF